jgi:zinc protease
MRKQAALPIRAFLIGFLGLAFSVVLAAQVKTVDELDYPDLPEFEVPQPLRLELENGMVVILMEDHELPIVSAVARIRTGSRLEPADKVGLASLTGLVLRTGGTEKMDSDELDDFLESRAANVSSSISLSFGSASMSCLKQDFPAVFRVFGDILRRPIFAEERTRIAVNQLMASISRQNDSPEEIMNREFDEIIYGEDSPYARVPTYASVRSITRDDMVAWHGKYYHPNRIILGLVGDFEAQEVLRQVKSTFADWPRGPACEEVEVPYRRKAQTGVYYVEKNDMNQSNLKMGHLGITRDNPDLFAARVLNHVLSGSFASRLFANVRSDKGLAYVVTGGIRSGWDYPGTFNMWMTTKTETTGAGIEALLEEAQNLELQPPTAEEVNRAKEGILNSFIFNVDTRKEILGQQLTYEYFGYPLDWLDRYRNGVENVTVEEVRRVAQKYIHPQQFVILVVGPSEGRDKPLSDFGEVTQLDISIPDS